MHFREHKDFSRQCSIRTNLTKVSPWHLSGRCIKLIGPYVPTSLYCVWKGAESSITLSNPPAIYHWRCSADRAMSSCEISIAFPGSEKKTFHFLLSRGTSSTLISLLGRRKAAFISLYSITPHPSTGLTSNRRRITLANARISVEAKWRPGQSVAPPPKARNATGSCFLVFLGSLTNRL